MRRHGPSLLTLILLMGTFPIPAVAQFSLADLRAINVPYERLDWPALSPSGEQVVFSAAMPDGRDHLCLVTAGGGAVTQITSGAGNDWSARFSPDGRQIAFVSDRSGNADIWILPAGGGEARQITTDPADDIDPDWSPDGSRLIFASSRGGPLLLYQVTLADRQVFALTAGSGKDRRPAWSPDGRWIAFQSTRDRNRPLIWLIPPEGGEPKRLSRIESTEESWPAWWTDGQKLLAQSGTPGTPGSLWLFHVDEDQRSPTQISIPPPPGADPGLGAPPPSLSRDGRRMAFIGSGKASIEIMPITGGNPATIVTSGGRLRHPSWSPEGRRLLLSGDMGGAWDLWIAGVSSGKLVRLTNDDAREGDPAWSAVTGDVLYTLDSTEGRSIHILEPETGRTIRISRGQTHGAEPAWSPDARSVAFVLERDGKKDIYIAPAGGGEPRRLAELPGAESHPTWSPDGKWIAFASDQGKGNEIWKVPVAGGAAVQITRVKEGFAGDTQPAWSSSDNYIAFIREVTVGEGGSDLYIISPQGGAPFPFRRGSGARILEPAWNPKGTHIAYSYSRPDQILLLEIGEGPIIGPPVPGHRGTPQGMLGNATQEPPAGTSAADPNTDPNGRS